MSKAPKKNVPAPVEAPVDPIDALLAAEPAPIETPEPVTSEGNEPITLVEPEPPVKAAAFMSGDPEEVVKALQASLPTLTKPEQPKPVSVPTVAPTIVKVSAKTLAEMERGRELIERYK